MTDAYVQIEHRRPIESQLVTTWPFGVLCEVVCNGSKRQVQSICDWQLTDARCIVPGSTCSFSTGGCVLRLRQTWIFIFVLGALCAPILWIRAGLAEPAAEAQGLWVADGNFIAEFQGPALMASGTPDATLTFSIKHYLNPFALAFDLHHDLWLAETSDLQSDHAIAEVRRNRIVGSKEGKKTNANFIRLIGPGVVSKGFVGLALDEAGNLWTCTTAGQIFEISSNRLGQRHPSPEVVIGSFGSATFWAIRFDASDNLWVNVGNSQMWKFTPADRANGRLANPSLIVDIPVNFGVNDIAFDSEGNEWLAGADFTVGDTPEIKMISATDLGGSGEIAPPITTITSSTFGSAAGLGGACLGGIDFDQAGNLWVSARCAPQSHLVAFAPSQLGSGGDITPTIILNPNNSGTNFNNPGPIKFAPALRKHHRILVP